MKAAYKGNAIDEEQKLDHVAFAQTISKRERQPGTRKTPLARNSNYSGAAEATGHTTAAYRTSAAAKPPPRSLTLARLVVALEVLPIESFKGLDLLCVHVPIGALIA